MEGNTSCQGGKSLEERGEEGIPGGESGYQTSYKKDIKDCLATLQRTKKTLSKFNTRRRRGNKHLSTEIPLDFSKDKNLDNLQCQRWTWKTT